MRPQIYYVLLNHADPLAVEPHDYADPFHVNQKARHCLNADDLLEIDDGRAASAAARWAAALSAGEVAPTCAPVAPRPRTPWPSPFLRPPHHRPVDGVSPAHKSPQALYSRSGELLPSAEAWADWRARQWHERGDPLPLSGESPRVAPVGLCAI